MSTEIIYDVYWEGPFKWDEREVHQKDHHVLYQIYGLHLLYGKNVLLYLGRTSDIKERFNCHDKWIEEEYDNVEIRLGSLGEFTTWEEWKEDVDYDKADEEKVKKIEALLIYANQPAYNQINKESASNSENIRIFNSGKSGNLLLEVSYKYFCGD